MITEVATEFTIIPCLTHIQVIFYYHCLFEICLVDGFLFCINLSNIFRETLCLVKLFYSSLLFPNLYSY